MLTIDKVRTLLTGVVCTFSHKILFGLTVCSSTHISIDSLTMAEHNPTESVPAQQAGENRAVSFVLFFLLNNAIIFALFSPVRMVIA